MARAGSSVRIKSFKTYTVEEAAEVVGVTEQTIRTWIRQGLLAMTEKRPTLILGWALKGFREQLRKKRRRPLQDGEFFCLHCKKPRTPVAGLVEYQRLSDAHGQLRGFCSACEGACARIISRRDLPKWADLLDAGTNDRRTA